MANKIMKIVYTVAGEGEKKRWIKIGVAFENKDGSLNVLLDALPVNGHLNIRTPKLGEGENK
jgi:hypothetical protein